MRLHPDEYARSAYEIDYERLYRQGFRGIVYDIDNTLVLPDAPADERAKALVGRLLDIGFRVTVVSNNQEDRVRSFAEEVGADWVAKALKPFPDGYRRACTVMNTKPEETLCIGDQVFTDIWGANRLGMHSILTCPFTMYDEIQIMLKRIAEKPVLFADRKRRKNFLQKRFPGSGSDTDRVL